jgi:hypothetical protein
VVDGYFLNCLTRFLKNKLEYVMRSPSKGVCGSSRMTVIRHISKSLTLVHNAVIVIRALVRIQLIILQ